MHGSRIRTVSHEVEATAYFVVSEAITNAVKHADASDITIRGVSVTGGCRSR